VIYFHRSWAVAEMGDRGHNWHGLKRGGLLCPFRGELEPCLIQRGLGRGLLPYQLSGVFIHPAVWPQDMNRKRGAVPLLGRAATPSNTTLSGPTFTSVPSTILIHPAVWPQQTRAENLREKSWVPNHHLTQCGQGRGLPASQVSSWSVSLATVHQRYREDNDPIA